MEQEKVLICISGAPSNARVIRAGVQLARAFNAEAVALFVQPPDFEQSETAGKKRLADNIALAKQLGVPVTTLYGADAAIQIAEYARVSGSTKIVLGKSPEARGLFSPKTLIERLNELAPDIDVFIIPDKTPPKRARQSSLAHERFSAADIFKMLAVLALCTLVGFGFEGLGFSTANVIIVYILGVLAVAMTTEGRSYSLTSSVLSVVIFNFFFASPVFSFSADPSHLATFVIMFAAALFISSLTVRVRRQAQLTAQRAYGTEILLETSQKLQKAETEADILTVTASQLGRLLERDILIYPVADGMLQTPMQFPLFEGYGLTGDNAVAQWVLENRHQAGCSTGHFAEAPGLYMAVRSADAVSAVVGILGSAPGDFEKTLTVALLDECAIVLENEKNLRLKRELEERAKTEQLRADLLRSISHDLRTPLTGISGNAALLMENELSPERRQAIYTDIYDDSRWLIELVENLLSITKIESDGAVKLQPELVGDVLREALRHIDRRVSEDTLTLNVPNELLMASMDARLIAQVVINLVNNAVQHTPAGSHIDVSASEAGFFVEIKIADDGAGIPEESKAMIFDLFYTGEKPGDSRRGLGLGLALCKSIVTAHGGSITVSDNTPHGAVFTFTLPKLEVRENG